MFIGAVDLQQETAGMGGLQAQDSRQDGTQIVALKLL